MDHQRGATVLAMESDSESDEILLPPPQTAPYRGPLGGQSKAKPAKPTKPPPTRTKRKRTSSSSCDDESESSASESDPESDNSDGTSSSEDAVSDSGDSDSASASASAPTAPSKGSETRTVVASSVTHRSEPSQAPSQAPFQAPLAPFAIAAPQRDTGLAAAASQMASSWNSFVPELQQLADLSAQQATLSLKLSAVANKLIGMHAGTTTSITRALEGYVKSIHADGHDGERHTGNHTLGNFPTQVVASKSTGV